VAAPEPQFHGTPRFRIVSRIGVGAIGELYKVMDDARGTFVALRTLRNVPPEAGEALKRDFRALRAVRHPSLVSLGELDCIDSLWFYTMEFVEGEPLLDYVRPRAHGGSGLGMISTGELSDVRLRSALSQLVRGIAALHQANRVHGNIEPEHIRATAQGRLVLLECDLGRRSQEGHEWEQRIVTALPFVAPERLEDAAPSPAADWYSMGAVLFQALSGVAPFSASGADLVEEKQRVVPSLPAGRSYPADLAELCAELMSIDPDARPDLQEIRQRLGIHNEAEARISQTFSLLGDAPPFVGRKRELGLLAEAFERTRHGAVSTLCLYGEAGLGKRTLTSQLAKKLRNDYPHLVHLTGRCEPDGPRAMRGLTGVIDSLSRYLGSQDASSVATLLTPEAALLPRLFPSMERVPLPNLLERVPQEAPSVRRTALRALRKLLRDLSKRHPLLVVIDDVQWIDADALNALDELTRPPHPPDMLLLMIVNGELRGADPPLRMWLERYADQITLMRLKELGEAASRELSERLLESGGLPDSRVSQKVAALGRGHPLRIDALARHYLLTSTLPSPSLSLDDLLWARVGHLPLDARQLLIALSYARIPLPIDVAAEASGLPLESIGRHIAVLRVANLGKSTRESDGERHMPSHPSVRAAVLTRADVDRVRVHKQIALAMSGWPKAPSDVTATHWRDAGALDRAARASARAADDARDMLAFDAAVKLYQEALTYDGIENDEERRLRTELAHAYASAGQSERAARAYVEAARYANPADALELERRAAHQLLRTGHINDGLKTVESVLGRLGVRVPTSSTRALLSLLLHRARVALRGTSFEQRDVSQIPPNDLIRADILGSLAGALGMIDTIRGADAQTRFLLLALRLGDPARVARALALEAGYLATASDFGKEWLETLARAEALALQSRDSQARGFTLLVRSTATFLSGKWRENVKVSEEAERVLTTECTDVDWEIGNTRVFRSVSHWYLGDLKGNAERVAELTREALERGDHYTLTNLRVALGYMTLLMANEPARAIVMLDESIESWSHSAFHMQHFFHLLGRTQVELYARGRTPYSRVMRSWPDLTKSFLLRVSMVAHTVQHLRARAAIAQAVLSRPDRELLLRDAADLGGKLSAARFPYAAGWGHAVRAGVDAVRGDKERAVQRLEQAEAAFYESDMTLYAAATRRQIGKLLGGDRGRELTSRAEEWFESQGIRKPSAFVAMLMPGFEP
jgi:serine/threonine protein kinase/tetratricopeptide (TPR) repeat protein